MGQNTWDLIGVSAFEGLGNAAHPFKGTLESAYTNGSLIYKLDKPLFQYLSTDAVVREMSMIGRITTNETMPKGVLAGTLVKGENDTSEMVTLENVIINGEVSNTGGAAGLVFGRVENGTSSSIRLSFDQSALKLAQKISPKQTIAVVSLSIMRRARAQLFHPINLIQVLRQMRLYRQPVFLLQPRQPLQQFIRT